MAVLERTTLRAKGPHGRGTSFGRDTSGFRGWIPVMFKTGSGTLGREQEGFKNVLTNEEFTPPEGWNGEPPSPTGEVVARCADSNQRYREGWERIWGKSPDQSKEEDHASGE